MKSRVPISSIVSKTTLYILLSIFLGLCGYYIYLQKKSISQQENYTDEYNYLSQHLKVLLYACGALIFIVLFLSRSRTIFGIILIISVITLITISITKLWYYEIFSNTKNILFFSALICLCVTGFSICLPKFKLENIVNFKTNNSTTDMSMSV